MGRSSISMFDYRRVLPFPWKGELTTIKKRWDQTRESQKLNMFGTIIWNNIHKLSHKLSQTFGKPVASDQCALLFAWPWPKSEAMPLRSMLSSKASKSLSWILGTNNEQHMIVIWLSHGCLVERITTRQAGQNMSKSRLTLGLQYGMI